MVPLDGKYGVSGTAIIDDISSQKVTVLRCNTAPKMTAKVIS